jgi:hypothetical protein
MSSEFHTPEGAGTGGGGGRGERGETFLLESLKGSKVKGARLRAA